MGAIRSSSRRRAASKRSTTGDQQQDDDKSGGSSSAAHSTSKKRKSSVTEEPTTQQQSEDYEEDYDKEEGCVICKQDNDHANLMLCEACEGEYHIYCLNPPLEAVPEGDWYCGTYII